jgi:hypothetical protein
VLAVAAWFGWNAWQQREDRLYELALRDYQEGHFETAAGKFQELLQRFPQTGRRGEYQFLVELSELRGQARSSTQRDPRALLERLDGFRRGYSDNPLLKQRAADVGQTLVKVLRDYCAWSGRQPQPAGLEGLAWAEQFLEEAQQRKHVEISDADRNALARDFAAARQAVVRGQERLRLLDGLTKLAAVPSADAVKLGLRLVKEEGQRQPELARDEAVRERLRQLRQGHFQRISYTAYPEPRLPARMAGDAELSLFVEPLVEGPLLPAAPPDDRVVLSLVRGVLYALAQSTGEVRWALRVGIDTSALPLRLRAAPATPELFLVLSTDTRTLTAVRARDGVALWKHAFDAPCLGRPVLVGRRAYLPTYDGLVHEVRLDDGALLGRFDLGQRLTVGGVYQEGTGLVYLPADDTCVYALDVVKKRCQAILYLDHPSGSLRSSPLVVGWPSRPGDAAADAGGPHGYLVLGQTEGLNAMRLRVLSLPLTQPSQLDPDGELVVVSDEGVTTFRPLMKAEPRVEGWSWFPPYYDPEKLALVTDAGALGLFGTLQFRNQDDPIFPLVRVEQREPGTLDLRAFLMPLVPSALPAARGRAQVVQAEGNEFWVLARGGLRRLALTTPVGGSGPRVIAFWPRPLPVGSPLHAGQADEGAATLFVTTLSPAGQTCLATAVDADSGEVRWQRQLGLVCPREPLALRRGVLALDQGGGLFQFDYRHWQSGAQLVARSLEDDAAALSYLLPGRDAVRTPPPEAAAVLGASCLVGYPGNVPWAALALNSQEDGSRPASAFQIASLGDGTRLVVRHYQSTPGGSGLVQEQTLDLSAPLAGTPAVTDRGLLVPLADGLVKRYPFRLPLDGRAPLFAATVGDSGPYWRRGGRTGPEVHGHVVWLAGDDFLTSDGGRALKRWRWPSKGTPQALPEGRDPRAPTVEQAARIGAAPVVLPEGDRVCVADIDGTVTLFQGAGLKRLRSWDVGGAITAGPYVQGRWIGCVVGRRKLVCIDPESERFWSHTTPGDGIVGQPQLVEGLIVVADQSGHFLGLDPITGKSRGKGYTLKANVAPAASPVSLGGGRAFAPLTDGTVLVLELGQLRDE